MRWLTPLQLIWAICFFAAGFGFMIGDLATASVMAGISAAAWLAFAFLACPRCGLHLGRRKPAGLIVPSLKPLPNACPKCGRSRLGVYPFQHLFRREGS